MERYKVLYYPFSDTTCHVVCHMWT